MAITTFNEYQELASRTANKHEYEQINYAMGLAGESGELIDGYKKILFHSHPIDKNYIKKEAGDVLWYSSQLIRIYQITFQLDVFEQLKKIDDDLEKVRKEGDVEKVVRVSCLILSKAVGDLSGIVDELSNVSGFYSARAIKGNISKVLKSLYFLIKFAGLTIEEVAEANIEKLKARYPEGFDVEKSINRIE